MKILPDSPNLDLLRQEAKDILAQVRVVTTAATLSDAQMMVAQQYGFASWAELAAEVERR